MSVSDRRQPRRAAAATAKGEQGMSVCERRQPGGAAPRAPISPSGTLRCARSNQISNPTWVWVSVFRFQLHHGVHAGHATPSPAGVNSANRKFEITSCRQLRSEAELLGGGGADGALTAMLPETPTGSRPVSRNYSSRPSPARHTRSRGKRERTSSQASPHPQLCPRGSPLVIWRMFARIGFEGQTSASRRRRHLRATMRTIVSRLQVAFGLS